MNIDNRAVVLMYHRVDHDARDPFKIRTSPENFVDHIEYLRENYEVVTVAALLDRLRSGASTAGLACVTFDDGYESLHSVVSDVLESLEVPATVFLTSDFLHGRDFWWERLLGVLDSEANAAGALPKRDISPIRKTLMAERNFLRSLTEDEREAKLALLGAMRTESAVSSARPLSDWQVLDLANGKFEIGCHTRAHPLLTSLDPQVAAEEINGSKKDLEVFLGRRIDYFSYPFGKWNEAVRRLVMNAGFKCAFRVGQQPGTSDLFTLPRLDAGNLGVDELASLLGKRRQGSAEARVGRGNSPKRAPAPKAISILQPTSTPQAVPEPQPQSTPQLVNFGDLARLEPISQYWGSDRGAPIDRGPIKRFLERHRSDIAGRVLEVKDAKYTRLLGRPDCQYDVLDIDRSNHKANIVANIENGEGIADNTYDCIVLTQVLQLVFDVQSAVKTLCRILKPGGVLLLTVSCITRARKQDGPWYWSFYEPTVRRLLAEEFDDQTTLVESHGNLCRATAFLYGLSEHDVPAEFRAVNDPEYPIVVTARAVKRSLPDGSARNPESSGPGEAGKAFL